MGVADEDCNFLVSNHCCCCCCPVRRNSRTFFSLPLPPPPPPQSSKFVFDICALDYLLQAHTVINSPPPEEEEEEGVAISVTVSHFFLPGVSECVCHNWVQAFFLSPNLIHKGIFFCPFVCQLLSPSPQ